MRWRRDCEGAVAIVVALVTCFVLIPVAAFTVDLGVQRVARQDMQSLSDVVALDLARLLDGRKAGQIRAGSGSMPALDTAKATSVARNTSVSGDHLDVKAVLVKLNADGSVVRSAGGEPAPVPDSGIPDAVMVTSTTDVGFRFLPGRGGVGRSAVATASQPSVCFSVGTRELSLDSSASALGPFLDQILKVNLQALDYNGIIGLKDVSVPLVGLMTELHVGTPQELATAKVSLADFISASATALQKNGDLASANLLNRIKLGVPGFDIHLSDIVDVGAATQFAGLHAGVNVLDILTAAVVAANGENAVKAGIGGVASLQVTEPPKIACGAKGATAHSAQVKFTLDPTLVTGPINSLGLTAANVRLDFEAAAGTAEISSDISCLPGKLDLDVTTGGAVLLPPVPPARGQLQAHVTMGKFLDFIPGLGWLLKQALKALGADTVGLDIALAAEAASTHDTRTVQFPDPPAPAPTVVVPESGVGSTLHLSVAKVQLATGQNGILNLLGDLLNGTVDALTTGLVEPVVNTVIDPAVTAILSPLLDFLGIKLGVAEVNFDKAPDCSGVKLIG